ncbi:hypothetical protein, partial [Psychroserpens mesophilus]|uniref:hypothetical protein n=1 Tax=Psychroserpens mesophilus TaxID=325473 RepID=UPI003D647857
KKSRYPKVFPNYESEVFFFDVLEQDWMKIDRAWVSQLFRLLKARFGRSNQEISIHATEKVFRIFWNELGYDCLIKDRSHGVP